MLTGNSQNLKFAIPYNQFSACDGLISHWKNKSKSDPRSWEWGSTMNTLFACRRYPIWFKSKNKHSFFANLRGSTKVKSQTTSIKLVDMTVGCFGFRINRYLGTECVLGHLQSRYKGECVVYCWWRISDQTHLFRKNNAVNYRTIWGKLPIKDCAATGWLQSC